MIGLNLSVFSLRVSYAIQRKKLFVQKLSNKDIRTQTSLFYEYVVQLLAQYTEPVSKGSSH